MVTRLEPPQISRFWNDIRDTLIYNLLPTADASAESMNCILAKMLSDEMQVWIVSDLKEDKEIIYALCITSITSDVGTETKNLLIYSLYGYRNVPQEMWQEGIKALTNFAKENGCNKIVAFTKVPRIVEIMKSLGGKAEYSFLEMEV